MACRVNLEVQTFSLPTLDPKILVAWANRRIEAARITQTETCSLHLTPEIAFDVAAKAVDSWRVAAVLLYIWAAEVAASVAMTTADT